MCSLTLLRRCRSGRCCQGADWREVVIAWTVKPGQRITPHVHPDGTDTWTIVAGQGDYIADLSGATQPMKAGDVAVARAGEVHGVHNSGAVPLVDRKSVV